jgi:serine/threonine-protein kinase RsbT
MNRSTRQWSTRISVIVTRDEVAPVQTSNDIVMVRQAVRQWAIEQGLGLVDQTKIVTAASELARNTLLYGHGGTVRLQAVQEGARKGVRLTFEDQGPGIANLELALTDGYTTGNGMGLGLSGSRRLVNEFDIWSRVGEGTRVTVTRWK